jgi:hypothetical protein
VNQVYLGKNIIMYSRLYGAIGLLVVGSLLTGLSKVLLKDVGQSMV